MRVPTLPLRSRFTAAGFRIGPIATLASFAAFTAVAAALAIAVPGAVPAARADDGTSSAMTGETPGDTANVAHPAAPNTSSAAARTQAKPVPREQSVSTEHSLRIDGRRIRYTATAGTLLLRDDKGTPDASMFYVAYTAPGEDVSHRPITFLFNGGPGAGSVFLLMGSLGPKRVHTASPAPTPPAPYELADNADSLIDKTDLVFVDAVGTGYSRPIGDAAAKRFYSVDGDLDAFGRFIERYLTLTQRWNSPKFLVGESYGAARAAMLAYRLGQREIAINGVVLLSSVLNANVRVPGYDLMSVRFLPSYAAVAWYHGKVRDVPPGGLPALVDEVRRFAAGPYAAALEQGDALPDAQRHAIAKQVARYTGLSTQFVLDSRLRIAPSLFRKALLRGQSRSVGRYDGRFEGIEANDAYDSPDYDASEKYVTGAFAAAFHDYLSRDLHYRTKLRYRVFNDAALAAWHWQHHAASGDMLALPYPAGDLAAAMRRNPYLHVLSANGYFDLATPFFSTEYDLAHMGLEPSLQANLTVTYYRSGHMIYLDDSALHALKSDLSHFYDTTASSAPVPAPASR